ncbi:hypothetical protein [Acinetobacter variabilis]|uniref:hypothetical protein n=1 Tax=Acinetobacter variabilis TaxID=70346 RepID=UPI0028A2D0C4|nr:hypothetical protein [Acinetobacter variabilis]
MPEKISNYNYVELLYSYEQQMKDASRRNALDEVEIIRAKIPQEIPIDYPQSNIFQNVLNTYFSEDLFDLLVNKGYNSEGLKEISIYFIEKNKSFLENLWDISLKDVDVFFLDDEFRLAEGRASSCKENEHYIILPKNLETCFLSDDLIIHELGHTVEYYFRRKDINNNRLASHRILSETIAHYGQFHYLATQNIEKRVSVLGSIVAIAIPLEIVKYCLEHNIQHWNTNDIIFSQNFKTLRKFYSIEKLEYLIQGYKNLSIAQIYHFHVEPRLGAILALSLQDNQEAIKSLCLAESNKDIKTILEDLGLNSEELLDFQRSDEILKKFIFQN